jgi:hypothetical protein
MSVSARDIAFAVGCKEKPDGQGNYSCRCPGPLHRGGDRNPSLSVKDGRDGKVLLHCFAGCAYDDIVAALARRGVSVSARP